MQIGLSSLSVAHVEEMRTQQHQNSDRIEEVRTQQRQNSERLAEMHDKLEQLCLSTAVDYSCMALTQACIDIRDRILDGIRLENVEDVALHAVQIKKNLSNVFATNQELSVLFNQFMELCRFIGKRESFAHPAVDPEELRDELRTLEHARKVFPGSRYFVGTAELVRKYFCL